MRAARLVLLSAATFGGSLACTPRADPAGRAPTSSERAPRAHAAETSTPAATSVPHAPVAQPTPQPSSARPSAAPHAPPREVEQSLRGTRPKDFGTDVAGVVHRFTTTSAELALTVDLCDGTDERSFDDELFDLLRAEKIPTTVFVTGRWARHHTAELRRLVDDPLFEIENHGRDHKPCTSRGREVFGIAGTRDLGELVAEIDDNAGLLAGLTGERPLFYRSGTAHFDDVCVEATKKLGQRPVGFAVAGDGGAGFDARGVERALVGATPGSIIILHGHRPRRFAAEGLRAALPELRERGRTFVTLSSVRERLVAHGDP
jgi:peptidoglycan/xylan/chitin deacetylase (PgdA/CDA1 family)